MLVFTVDCFTERPFAGSPAAVCLLDSGWPSTPWLQQLSGELGLPAAAFVHRGRPRPELRWFSPHSELVLCGSGTLAAAHVLWENGYCPVGTAAFDTCAGLLGAQHEPDGRITLDFPADPPRPVPTAAPALTSALGVAPVAVARGRLDLLVELACAATVAGLQPDLTALAALDVRGVIVTAAGGQNSDFVSRFFAPSVGIDEDPVTASAHCTLGAYWAARLQKTALTGHQISARGGRVDLRLRDNRVDLTGRAITVIRGELAI